MNIDFIPFQIGEQYENWEFDLEPVKTSKTYDKYRYIKTDQKELLNVPVKQILLTFNLDILFQVEYYFEVKYFQQLKSKLIEFLGSGTFRDYRDGFEWENGEDTIRFLIMLNDNILILNIINKNCQNYI